MGPRANRIRLLVPLVAAPALFVAQCEPPQPVCGGKEVAFMLSGPGDVLDLTGRVCAEGTDAMVSLWVELAGEVEDEEWVRLVVVDPAGGESESMHSTNTELPVTPVQCESGLAITVEHVGPEDRSVTGVLTVTAISENGETCDVRLEAP